MTPEEKFFRLNHWRRNKLITKCGKCKLHKYTNLNLDDRPINKRQTWKIANK